MIKEVKDVLLQAIAAPIGSLLTSAITGWNPWLLMAIIWAVIATVMNFTRGRGERRDSCGKLTGVEEVFIASRPALEKMLEGCSQSFCFLGVAGNTTVKNAELEKKVLELGRKRGEIRFLLLNPQCTSIEERAKDEGADPAVWRQEIKVTIDRLRGISKKEGIDIQIRVYKEYPIWRMVIVDGGVIYLQYFLPGVRGSQSPMLRIKNIEGGLFSPMKKAFDELWGRADEVP